MATAKHILPPLPFAYDALQPYISEQIMTLHHSKHHRAYVNNLNDALYAQLTAISINDIVGQLHLQATINFNAGGHINHTLFWANLVPADSSKVKESSCPELSIAIKKHWGSIELFKNQFNVALMGIKGSGWGWLVQSEDGHLEIITTKDQDITPKGKKPLLGIDMWEHAYYLQYLNDKQSYVTGIWNVINWEVVEQRFLQSAEEVYGVLHKLLAAI